MARQIGSTSPGIVAAALPVAAAIGVFGVVYGAAARPVLGPELAVASSVVTFSGAAQFTMIGMLAAGTGPGGVLVGVTTLAVRHLPLGAVLRTRLTARRGVRAALSWFLIDETTGLAMARGAPVERALAVSGGLAYAGWIAGTVAGVAGASLASIAPLAEALFPVLFVGLAGLTTTTRADARRALVAGAAALALLLVWPGAGALGAIGVALAVAAAPA